MYLSMFVVDVHSEPIIINRNKKETYDVQMNRVKYLCNNLLNCRLNLEYYSVMLYLFTLACFCSY